MFRNLLLTLCILFVLPLHGEWKDEIAGVVKKLNSAEQQFPAGTWNMYAAEVPEKTFTRNGVQTRPDLDATKVISMDRSSAIEFYLPTLKEGLYLVAFQCRTGGSYGGTEDEVAWFDFNRGSYTLQVDGVEYPLRRSNAKPALAYRGQSWGNFVGWPISRDFIHLKPGCRVRVISNQEYQFIARVALLTPAQAMACDWLVPDMLEKAFDQPQFVRKQLVFNAGDSAETGRLLKAFDSRFEDYKARVAKCSEEYRKAKEQKDSKLLKSNIETRTKLLKESDNSLCWIEKEAAEYVRNLLVRCESLPAIPAGEHYYARRARIYRHWIELYVQDFQKKHTEKGSSLIAKMTGRAIRLAKLVEMYTDAVKQVPANAAPAAVISETDAKTAAPAAKICLNGLWEFTPCNDPVKQPEAWQTKIRVPHGPWQEYFGSMYNVGEKWNPDHHVGWYRTQFFVPENWNGNSGLRFESVFYYTEVYVNGTFCGSHLGGFDRFFIPVSRALKPGKINELVVMAQDAFDLKTLPQTKEMRVPPNFMHVHSVADTILKGNYGGIWQDVYLETRPGAPRIRDVAIVTKVKDGKKLQIKAFADNTSAEKRSLKFRFTVLDGNRTFASLESKDFEAAPGSTAGTGVQKNMPKAELWGVGGEYGSPHLYRLKTELVENGKVLDTRYDTFGFSQLWIEGDKFVLNGKKLFLAGGGVWYLNEVKFPQGNRFYFRHLCTWDRKANVNIERMHRAGDVTETFYEEASEAGMLMELEREGGISMLDLCGNHDFNDPVKVESSTQYYRSLASKHRNFPCMGQLSLDNEYFAATCNQEAMDFIVRMSKVVRQEDPLRLFTVHGNHMMADEKELLSVNLHYCSPSNLDSWKAKAKGRPIFDGEHNVDGQNRQLNGNREIAAKGEKEYADAWARDIAVYVQKAAGLYMFVPAFNAYCSTSCWEKTTPWGDTAKDLSKMYQGTDNDPCGFGYMFDIPWPSLSGPDTKGEKSLARCCFCTFNWFDTTRPVCTPNLTHDAMRTHYPAMAPAQTKRTKEFLVTVKDSSGKPCRNVFVTAEPLEGQGILTTGSVTDPAGTAWIVPRLPGKYKITAHLPNGTVSETAVLETYSMEKAGYEPGLCRVALQGK